MCDTDNGRRLCTGAWGPALVRRVCMLQLPSAQSSEPQWNLHTTGLAVRGWVCTSPPHTHMMSFLPLRIYPFSTCCVWIVVHHCVTPADKLPPLAEAQAMVNFARAEASKRARGLMHPQLCLDAVAVGIERGGQSGLQAEGEGRCW